MNITINIAAFLASVKYKSFLYLLLIQCICYYKRAQGALGCSPEEKVKGNSAANYRPQGHNLNKFGRGPFDDVIY